MKYHVIAIEREYASGGQEIGSLLAQRLGIPCYGREILQMAADQLNMNMASLEKIEEKATGSVLYSMYVIANMTRMGGDMAVSSENELFIAESDIIRRLTQTPAVIVGRCAVDSLRERNDVLRVFIHADLSYRRRRAVDSYGIDPENVDSMIRRADRRRESCYKLLTGNDWRTYENYHLVLDSALLGTDRCADILEAAVQGQAVH